MGLKEFFVKPRAADINENVLSEQARDELGLQEDQVRSGKPLESAIEEVSLFLFFFQRNNKTICIDKLRFMYLCILKNQCRCFEDVFNDEKKTFI